MLHHHTRLLPALLRYPLLAFALGFTACGGGESGPPQGSYPVQEIAPITGGAPDLGSGSYALHFRSAAEWTAFWASHTTAGQPYTLATIDFAQVAVGGIVLQSTVPAEFLEVTSIHVEGTVATVRYARRCIGGSSCVGTPVSRALSRWFLLPVGVQSLQALAST